MIRGERKLTPAQYVFILIQTQIGVSILALPNETAQIVHQDSWIAILIAGFFIQLDIYIIWALTRRFPNFTLYEIIPVVLGKPLGKILHIIYILYTLSTATLVTILFTQLMNTWIFSNTPNFVLNLLIILVGLYISLNSIVIMSRFYMFVSLLLLVPLGLSIYVLTDVNWMYLLPVGGGGSFTKLFTGSTKALFSMLGFETLLFLYPHIAGNSFAKLKATLVSNGFVTLFYCFLTVISLVYFSPEEIVIVPRPVLYMLKEFSFSLLERTDLLFLTIWVICITTSFMTYLYLSSTGLANLLNKKSHSKMVPFTAGICLIVSSVFEVSEGDIELFTKFFTYFAFTMIFIVPLLLLIMALLRRKKESKHA